MEDIEMTLVEHLAELRTRLMIALGSVIVLSGASYLFSETILAFLTRPAGELVFLGPAEAFYTHLKVSLFSGLLLALPVVCFQVWKFLLPALKGAERRLLLIMVPGSVLLFLAGLSFCFFLVLPLGLRFLLDFSGPSLEPMLSLSQYISFLLTIMLPFGLIFQVPLVMSFLVRYRLVTVQRLVRFRKYALVLIFFVCAVLTPPDVITQMMMALPLVLLFEGSLILARIIAPREREGDEE